MLSLWSAVNPGVWVSKGPAEGGTWTIPGNASIDVNTRMLNTLGTYIRLLTAFSALTPFWNSQTGYWASTGTTATAGLHYSYPEFNGLNLGDPQGVRRSIATWINQHYGGGQFSLTSSAVPAVNLLAQPPAAGSAPAPAAQGHEQSTFDAVSSTVKSAAADIAQQVHGQSAFAAVSATVKHAAADIAHQVQGHGSHPHPPHQGQHPTVIYDWAARIHAKKYELGHGFVVLIFLGEVPDDPSQWRAAPSFVGAHVSFVNTDAEQCANCREQAELEVEGFVHLNGAIAKRSGLSSYEPSAVAPYLKANLHWRVQAVCTFQLPSLSHFEALTLLSPTFIGRSICGPVGQTHVSGGHRSVEHFDPRTRRCLPDCRRSGVSQPHYSRPHGRCSRSASLKYLENDMIERNGRRGSVLRCLSDVR